MVRLSEIFCLQMGKTPARANVDYWEDGTNSWVSIADLSNYEKYVGQTKEKITDLAVRKSGIKAVPPNTVIMSFKLSLGKTAITQEPIYTNEAIMAFIPKDTCKILPDYLFYVLSSRDWSDGTNRAVMGVTLNKAVIGEINIEIPPYDEQCQVAMVLDKVSVLISLRKQQLAKLDELVKARFLEMFGDPVSNSMGWNVSDLKHVTSKIGSGATPKGGRESYPTEGITLIRSMNVHDGYFEYKDLAHLNGNQAEQLSNAEVNKDDVFINITGASVARSCIVPENVIPARVNQHVSIIRCKQSIFKPVFANQQFLNASFKKKLLELGEAGGATRQAITKQQLEELAVIVPPPDLQNLYAAFTQQVNQQKQTIQQSLTHLETLKKTLMQEYFG